MATTAVYGKWKSPITIDAIGSNTTISDVLVDPIKNVAYYIVEDPEHATSILYETRDGISEKKALPDKYSARNSVNDYGGAAATVYDGIVYFSNPLKPSSSLTKQEPDNSVYAYDRNQNPPVLKQLTPDKPLLRYANFAVHPRRHNLLAAIQEDHTKDPKGSKPRNVVYRLAIIDAKADSPAKAVYTLREGAGFYASPVFNLSGNKIAWQEWDLPDMPWEGGQIYVADLISTGTKLRVSHIKHVAGKKSLVSAAFPTWITDTTLLYTSDKDNKYQNPFIYDAVDEDSTAVVEREQDFAEPAWRLGLCPYAILGKGTYAAFTAFQDGKSILYIANLEGPSEPVRIENFDFAVAQHIRPLGDNEFVFTGAGATSPGGVFQGTIEGSPGAYTAKFKPLKTTGNHAEWQDYVPEPHALTVPGNYDVHVIYYLPTNPHFVAPPTELPPCIVNVHGGPTRLESQALDWTKAFYTSRGYAWLDVNHRGSSGYGRKYIELLNGNWGKYDSEDCKLAHKYFVGEGLFDPKRVAIRGGSAGAYTTLSSVTFADKSYYKAACAVYGCIADPTYLTKVIAKFEYKYFYSLFGSKPDGGAWHNRTPIRHINNPTTPLLVLQGAEDRAVPIKTVNDSVHEFEKVAHELVKYKVYPREGHRFREKAHIVDALHSEHAWYEAHLL